MKLSSACLAAVLLTACVSSHAGPRGGRDLVFRVPPIALPDLPTTLFPSRAEVARLAASVPPGAEAVARSGAIRAADWTFDPASMPAETMLPEPGIGAGIVTSPALKCAARQVGRFALAQGAIPDQALTLFLASRCGGTSPAYSAGVLRMEGAATDEEVHARHGERVREAVRSAAAGQPADVGIAIVREGSHAVVAYVLGLRKVRVHEVAPVPDAAGNVTFHGTLLDTVGVVRAWVTRGAYDVAPCQLSRTPLPRFAIRCPIAPGDRQAFVEVMLQRPDAALLETVARLVVVRDRAEATRFTVPRVEGTTTGVSFEAGVVELVRGIRARLGYRPLRHDASGSAFVASVAQALCSPRASTEAREGLTRGIAAAHDVAGDVANANVFLAESAATSDPAVWLAHALLRPSVRWALLGPDAEVLTLGRGGNTTRECLVGATFTFDDPSRRAAQLEQAIAALDRARVALGRQPVRRATTRLDMPSIMREVESGPLPLESAIEQMGQDRIDTGHPDVFAGYYVTTSLDLAAPVEDLAELDSVELIVGISRVRPRAGGWGYYVVYYVGTP